MAVEKTQGVFTTFNSDTQSTYTGIGIVGAPGIADQFFLTTRLFAPDFKGASEQPGFIVIFRLT